MVEFVEYCEKYREDVIECLKRNFPKLKDISSKQVEKQFAPCWNYSWTDEIDSEVLPYVHGMIIVEDDRVVGYLGLFYSCFYENGNKYVYANPTTWAIDSEYTFQVFEAMKIMVDSADLIGDFTPSAEMTKISKKLYGFSGLDKEICKILPLPCLKKNLIFECVKSADEITLYDIRKKYQDHKEYDVKCIKVISETASFYVFYKMTNVKIRNTITLPFARILFSSDLSEFSKCVHDITWFLLKKEKSMTEIESRFIGEDMNLSGCLVKRSVNKKLVLNKVGTDALTDKIGLLYSELAVLCDNE